MKGPTCRYCGQPIPKFKVTRYIRDTAMAARGVMGSDAITVEQLPRTKEEAQRLVNWTIERVERLTSGQSDPGGIFSITGWDGESYAPRYRYFCKIKCAAAFGQMAASRM